MQQLRLDSFLEEDDDNRVARMMRGGEENNENYGNEDEGDPFLEEVSDEVAPLLSDAERFWGASAAPEKVVASVEDFMADFVEGLLRGQLLNIELVREEDRER